ncbi:MAG: ROK family protein, partial [Bacteroidales bacterium]|nr:ROK family protein [Bacteroidales bacterium]
LIMKPVRESYDRNILRNFKGKTKIILSEMKDADAAILGASALGWEAKV